MEATVKSQFNQEILDRALSRYGIDPSEAEELDAFESFVYQCRHQGKDRILRISHSRRRPWESIAGEIDWLNYLFDRGMTVCRAVPSKSGDYCEILSDEREYFTAAVFERALGQPSNPEIWRPPLFEAMGAMMGRMHALTQAYKPGNSRFKRPQWHEAMAGMAEKFIPADQQTIIDKIDALNAETQRLPISPETYGLVHFDFHRGNFLVEDQGRIHLFDFDDSQCTWFADDIAIALFYAIPPDCSSSDDLAQASQFLTHFLAGYRSENQIPPEWLARLPLFLKRREMDVYTVVHRSADLNNLNGWTAQFMEDRAARIEEGVPFVDLDFARF